MNTEFLDLCRRRLSCRAYKPDPVPREMIEKILEAARIAPSACNKQPWRFLVATDPAVRRKILDAGIIPGIGMDWLAGAPVILVLGMKRSFITHKVATRISKVDYPLLDLGIAGEHAILQATELGLGTCWVGWINPEAIRKAINWPREILPQSIIPIGWPAEPLPQPRPRLGMNEIAEWR